MTEVLNPLTREAFNAKFAFRMDNTDGFTQEEINAMNDAVFAEFEGRDMDDNWFKSEMDKALEDAAVWTDTHRVA